MRGTDGQTPRIPFRDEPSGFDTLAAIHMNPDFSIHHAIATPTSAILPLYARRRHSSGLGHVPLADLISLAPTEDITAKLAAALDPAPAT